MRVTPTSGTTCPRYDDGDKNDPEQYEQWYYDASSTATLKIKVVNLGAELRVTGVRPEGGGDASRGTVRVRPHAASPAGTRGCAYVLHRP